MNNNNNSNVLFWGRLIISIISIVVICILLIKEYKMNHYVVFFMFLAAIPWVSDIIESIQLFGLGRVDFQGIKETVHTQQEEIEEQKEKLKMQKKEIEEQVSRLKGQKEELESQLNVQKEKVEVQQGQIINQEMKLNSNQEQLEKHKRELENQQQIINQLVVFSMSNFIFNHLKCIYEKTKRLKQGFEEEYIFRKNEAFERDLRYLKDHGYLHNFYIRKLEDGENLIGKLELTPVGEFYVELRNKMEAESRS